MDNRSRLSNPLLWAFVACIIYWSILFFSSSMIILYDSLSYRSWGARILEQGWVPYFQTGPNREPVYLAVIALSMGLGKLLSVPFEPVLKVMQLLVLFLTQVLALKILRGLKVRDAFSALCILYLGFSPALVNSALSLYSEIVTYPAILTIVLLSAAVWKDIQGAKRKLILLGLGHGLALITVTFIKGIFEVISLAYLLIFTFTAIGLLIKKKSRSFSGAMVFVLASFLAFYTPLTLFKTCNKIYNGNFALTNRGAWALYGQTARRTEPLTGKQRAAALAYAPGEGVCRKIFDEETCRYWSYQKSDEFGYSKLSELGRQALSEEEVDKKLIRLSLQRAAGKPVQYGLLAGVEGLKMAFWESTQIGFVDYPDWLQALYNTTLFGDGLRLILSLLTFAALLYAMKTVFSGLRQASLANRKPDGPVITLSCLIALVLLYIGLHSLFFVLTRYALPIAPLHLIAVAFLFDRVLPRKKQA